jgi:molybdenum cofactor cytidylyltransferase
VTEARGEKVGTGFSRKARDIKETEAPRRFDRIAEGSKVGAVILAAGASSRFRAGGGPDPTKLVAKLDGKPIVRRVVEAALATKARPVAVVTGYARDVVESVVADLEASFAFNPDFASGLASSLSVGLLATPRDVAGVLVLLGDMPLIEPRLADALIEAFLAREGALAAVPLTEGRRGNPVLLGRGLFEAALRLKGDEGARKLIGALNEGELVEVEASDMGVTFDVDTPEDLAAARRFGGDEDSPH